MDLDVGPLGFGGGTRSTECHSSLDRPDGKTSYQISRFSVHVVLFKCIVTEPKQTKHRNATESIFPGLFQSKKIVSKCEFKRKFKR